MKPKVLITDAVHQVMIENFEASNFEVTYQPTLSNSEVYDIIENYSMLVINSKILIDKKMIDRASNLRVIGRLGSGKEIIDLAYCAEREIVFHNSPEGNRDAVAEHAMGLLLSLLHNIQKSSNEVKEFNWLRERNRGIELKGKTVAIIGYGNTGMEMAKRLSAFGVRILAVDKYKQNYSDQFVVESTMANVAKSADVVSVHLPLTSETTQLMDAKWFAQFHKQFFFINTSRGKIVHTKSLIEALESKLVIGAAVDVLENENLTSYSEDERNQLGQLLAFENVIITPHIAGWTFESKFKLADLLSNKMILSWNYHRIVKVL